MQVLIVLVIIAAFVLLFVMNTYNRLISLKNKVYEALSGIDVALARRYDTLTNMVDVVKNYAKYEEMVLTKLMKLRNQPTMSQRMETDVNQIKVTNRLLMLSEGYPKLKANENFLDLQRTIRDIEEHLAASRRMYNANVTLYNDLVLKLPSSLIAKVIKAHPFTYFVASSEESKIMEIQLD